jgi:high-affinity iron transporter
MLLDITILVLRETLEASVLFAVLLSIAAQSKLGAKWLFAGIVGGALMAAAYSTHFSAVSQWFEYAGQEVLNSTLQFAICISLLIISFWRLFMNLNTSQTFILRMMFLVVVLALTRELTELVIFYSGIIQAQGSWTNAVTGGFAGLTIGASIGVLVFATIDRLSLTFQMIVQVVLLALVAAGTVVQGIQLLMQVDWVSATSPVWDTNHLLAEVSITGQMFYAVFGYEATPTLLEVVFYWSTITIAFTALFVRVGRSQLTHLKERYANQ